MLGKFDGSRVAEAHRLRSIKLSWAAMQGLADDRAADSQGVHAFPFNMLRLRRLPLFERDARNVASNRGPQRLDVRMHEKLLPPRSQQPRSKFQKSSAIFR